MAHTAKDNTALPGGFWPQGRGIQEKQICLIVFTLDLLVLLMAYQMSLPLAAFLVETFGTSSLDTFYPTAETHAILYFSLSLGILFFLFLNGHYTKRVPWWTQIQQISKFILFALLVDGFAHYALDLHYSRILIVTNWVTASALIVMMRLGVNILKSRSEAWRLPAIVMADAHTATDALYALCSDKGMGLAPQAILLTDGLRDLDREELPAPCRNIRIVNGKSREDCEAFIQRHAGHFFIISLDIFPQAERERLIGFLGRNGIDFSILPAIHRTSVYHAEPHYFFGNDIVLLENKRPALLPVRRALKRGMDMTGALTALTIFILPMLLVALCLKLEGQGGTPLYAGMRVGQGGRRFRCWKFRTMEPGTDHLLESYLRQNPAARAHWERYFKLPDDPRVQTRTARLIRKASIDELPQLWNVLKGDMSLVGPRPILESEIEAYGEQIEEYYSVKPGITGLWQASGRNGTSFRRRVVWDSWYVRNWSLWGDIVIILKTIQVVLTKSGAS